MAKLVATGQTVAYTRQFITSIGTRSHAIASRRGVVLGPANMDTESGHIGLPVTADTWLIEVAWNDGAVSRVNPKNVCLIRSVAFVE